MYYSLVLLAAFTIFNGCFCNAHPKKKRLASTDVTIKDSLDISTSKEGTTNFQNVTREPFATKRANFSNKTEINQSTINVNVSNVEEEKVVFSKWKYNVIGKMKHMLMSFFESLEQEPPDLHEIEQVSDNLTHLKLTGPDIDDFLRKAKNALVETTKTGIEHTKNTVETVGENIKKIVTRNTPSYNATDSVVDETLRGAEHSPIHKCNQRCKERNQIADNITMLDLDNYTSAYTNNSRNDERTTMKEAETENNSPLTNKDFFTKAITKNDEFNDNSENGISNENRLIEKKIIVIVAEQTVPKGTDAVSKSNGNHIKNGNQKSNTLDEGLQLTNGLQEKLTSSEVNTAIMHLKPIDKNTEYFFGEASTDGQTFVATHHIHNTNDNNTSSQEKTTATPEEHINMEPAEITMNFKEIKKCEGTINGSRCIKNETMRRETNTAKDSTIKKENETLSSTSETYNTSNQNMTSHHFLFYSGGTEKSTTAASDISTVFENSFDKIDLEVDPNKMMLEIESLHQLPNVQKDLPLKRHRRIKRDAIKLKHRKTHYTEASIDEIVTLDGDTVYDDNDENTTTRLRRKTTSPLFVETTESSTHIITEKQITNITTEVSETSATEATSTSKTKKSSPTTKERPSTREELSTTTEKLPPRTETSSIETSSTETSLTETSSTETVQTPEIEAKTTAVIDHSTVQIASVASDSPNTVHQQATTSVKSDFDREETVFTVSVPETGKKTLTSILVPKRRTNFEREWNDAGGIPTRPLLLLVTVPSFIGMGAFIIALCFITRTGGWCCRLFDAHSSVSQTSISRDIQEPLAANSTRYYK